VRWSCYAAQDSAESRSQVLDKEPPQAEPERRQLSIMSCELVWRGRDLEDMRDAVITYQKLCQ
jgi:hypothetical protein